MGKKTFAFVFPAELKTAVEECAKKHDLSIAQIIRAAIREYLAKMEVKDA